jgi:hypothetical protein
MRARRRVVGGVVDGKGEGRPGCADIFGRVGEGEVVLREGLLLVIVGLEGVG